VRTSSSKSGSFAADESRQLLENTSATGFVGKMSEQVSNLALSLAIALRHVRAGPSGEGKRNRFEQS